MSPKSKFKAVLFDLGGTLIKTAEAPEIHRRILEAYGVKAHLNDVKVAHEANEKEFDVDELVEMGQDFWIKWNLRLLERLGIHENREFLARKIDELWWEYADLEAYPDVMQTLIQLKARGIGMGMVSNAFEKDFRQIFERLDLARYFDVIVGIDACKKGKPDRAIFLYAVNRLNVQPEEAMFVGDSVKHDYEGAEKAGLKPLIINREEKALMDVETITQLTEVLSYF